MREERGESERERGSPGEVVVHMNVPTLMFANARAHVSSRTLLIGANGAGKSSLLRILAGRHFHSPSKCLILGRPAFHDTTLGRIVAHLGERWGYTMSGSSCCSVNVCAGAREALGDRSVQELLDALENPDLPRIETLLDVLAVDKTWRIHRLSDGQRRRVQLVIGLARKSELLLLDEVTTDLDVVARQDLLNFLKEESEQRGVTLIYATHIFDGLEHWATDVVYLTDGSIKINCPLANLPELEALKEKGVPAPLFRLVEVWLREEIELAAQQRSNKNKKRILPANAERTYNTGFSRGSVIPTPNLNPEKDLAGGAGADECRTQAQIERQAWQLQQNGSATVCKDEGEGLFTAGLAAFRPAP
jgi:CCR4-NOT complex subunit CAF16